VTYRKALTKIVSTKVLTTVLMFIFKVIHQGDNVFALYDGVEYETTVISFPPNPGKINFRFSSSTESYAFARYKKTHISNNTSVWIP
jgi:hypothetical protein